MATEYISREEAIKAVDFEITYLTAFNLETGEMTHPFEERNKGLMEGIEALKKVPAADVVEVVRCKDCVHLCMTGLGTWCFFHPQGSLGHDDFCSAGERRKPHDR